MLALLRNTGRTQVAQCAPFIQKRGIKKNRATRKPFIRFQTNPDGTIKEPTSIRGYDPDEVARYNKWLKRAVVRVSRSVCVHHAPSHFSDGCEQW